MKTITGNTYPVKDRLKALGGRWNSEAKGWDIPDDKAQEAETIVASAGPIQPRSFGGGWRRRSRYGSTYTRFSSGAEVYTNRNGRCEDAPCCGCCS